MLLMCYMSKNFHPRDSSKIFEPLNRNKIANSKLRSGAGERINLRLYLSHSELHCLGKIL